MKNIVCEGHYSADHGKYLISLSAIFSHLIRECGRLVEDYNADLFYDMKSIEACAEYKTEEPVIVFWVGLRESGVDHEAFVECRCDNDYYYRGLYKVTVEKGEFWSKVTLEKKSAYDFRKEHKNNNK